MRAYPTVDGSLAVFWRDVTERHAAEEAVRQSEENYRMLFETMTQGSALNELVRDARGRVVDVRLLELNPAFERLLGIPVATARGRTAREVMPGLEEWWFETSARIVSGGAAARFEREVAALGRWYDVSVHPRGGDRFSVTYDDITPRRTAEAALRESEERFRALAETSPLGVGVSSADGKIIYTTGRARGDPPLRAGRVAGPAVHHRL